MGILSKLFGHKTSQHPYCAALVPAAGTSSRMGGLDKLFYDLYGQPVLARTLLALDRCDRIDEIVVAARQENILRIGELCRTYNIRKPVKIVEGGKTRAESVLQAALSADARAEFLAVHDGARPLIEQSVIEETIQKAYQCAAAAPATPVKDTIKVVDEEQRAVQTPDRRTLWQVQTPQAFSYELILKAYDRVIASGEQSVTDDAQVLELAFGRTCRLIEGSYQNIKVTTPEDLDIAQVFLKKIWKNVK